MAAAAMILAPAGLATGEVDVAYVLTSIRASFAFATALAATGGIIKGLANRFALEMLCESLAVLALALVLLRPWKASLQIFFNHSTS